MIGLLSLGYVTLCLHYKLTERAPATLLFIDLNSIDIFVDNFFSSFVSFRFSADEYFTELCFARLIRNVFVDVASALNRLKRAMTREMRGIRNKATD